MSTENQKNPKLKHNSAIHQDQLMYGVPTPLFFGACSAIIVFFITIGWLGALIIFFLTIPPLIVLHKDDPKAFVILFDKLRRPDCYVAGGVINKPIKIVHLSGKKIFLKKITSL